MYRGDAPMMALIRELPGVTEVTEQDCREDGCHLLLIRYEMDADLRAQVSALCYENHCALLEETNGQRRAGGCVPARHRPEGHQPKGGGVNARRIPP